MDLVLSRYAMRYIHASAWRLLLGKNKVHTLYDIYVTVPIVPKSQVTSSEGGLESYMLPVKVIHTQSF